MLTLESSVEALSAKVAQLRAHFAASVAPLAKRVTELEEGATAAAFY